MMRLTRDQVALTGHSYRLLRNSFRGEEFFADHNHDFYEFFLVVSGELRHELNGVVRILHPGTLQLLHPNDHHRLSCATPGGRVEIYNCNVQIEELLKNLHFLTARGDATLENCPQTLFGLPEPTWCHLLARAEQLLAAPDDRAVLWRSFCQQILALFLERGEETAETAPPWLAEAVRLMQRPEHFRAGLPRFREFAARSLEHLCRSMRLHYGLTPQSYINRLRLQEAARQLTESTRPVTAIAYDVGFANLSYFRRRFLEEFGLPPRDYRKKLRHR